MSATNGDRTVMDDPSSGRGDEFNAFYSSFPCIYSCALDDLIRNLRSEWKDIVGFDISHPCSLSSDSPNCWILRYLSPLNKHLRQVNIDAAELTPGYLTLSSINTGPVFDVFERGYLVGCFVALFVVKMHRCVQRLELGRTAFVFNYPDVLASSIASAVGLREIRLSPGLGLQKKYSFSSAISALRQSDRLEYLNLSGFVLDSRTSDELAQLLPNSRINSLVISLDLSPRAARKLLQAINTCPCLKALSAHEPDRSSDILSEVLASALAKSKTLKSFSLMGGSVKTAENILEALKTSALEDLALQVHPFPFCYRSRSDMWHTAGRLKTLRYSQGGFNIPCPKSLADALVESFCVLEKLDLSYTFVPDDAIICLAEALLGNNTLKQLNLEGCSRSATCVEHFVSSLAQNSTIECVRLGAVQVCEKMSFSPVERMVGRLVTLWNTCGAEELARVLRSEDCTVTTLELGWTNGVLRSCVADVFQAMCESNHITELCVHYSNKLGSAAGIILFLQNTRTLRRLRVWHNYAAYDSDLRKLLYALSENHTVTEAQFIDFALRSNEVVSALGTLLRFNKQLTALTFLKNGLDGCAARCLAHAMMENYTMTIISFKNISKHNVDYTLILDILNRNRSLRNRAIQFLRTGLVDCLDAFRKLSGSISFAVRYAASENIPLQQVRDTIAAALDFHGRGTE